MSSPDAMVLLQEGERTWGDRVPAACDGCGRTWLVDEGEVGERCGCGRGRLEVAPARAPSQAPEQQVPARVAREALLDILSEHVQRVRMRDKRLSGPDLADRAVLVWWPRWLVDVSVDGPWSAEVGFDYEAHSNVEHYRAGSWVTEEQIEVRVRWEGRTGTLARRYDNVVVPALLDEGAAAGLDAAVDLPSPLALAGGRLLLPDRSPSEVWGAAEPAFRERAAADVQRAAAGQHVRAMNLAATWTDPTWTLRVHPVWWTWYTDHDGVVHNLIVDGVSGRPWGPVMASVRIGWAWAAGIGAIGAGLLGLAVVLGVAGILFPPVLAVAVVAAVVGVMVLVGALSPLLAVWTWNASQRKLGSGLGGGAAAP